MSDQRWKVKSKVWSAHDTVMESEGITTGENRHEAIRAHKEYLRDKFSCKIIDINVTSVVKAKAKSRCRRNENHSVSANKKVCVMNCGPHIDDPRTAEERQSQCEDCLEQNQ